MLLYALDDTVFFFRVCCVRIPWLTELCHFGSSAYKSQTEWLLGGHRTAHTEFDALCCLCVLIWHL